MRLKRQTDYALQALVLLGELPERRRSISEMARACRIPHSHLAKVVNELVKGGYLLSVRGRRGGVRLAEPTERISLGSVVRLMERDFDVVECEACIISDHCGLTQAVARAFAAYLHSLDAMTLADVAPEPAV